MEECAKALPPSRVIGLRVKEFRNSRNGRRWTQERLAQELREVGIQIGQTDVARIEKLSDDTGKGPRPVTVEDWLALAFVLDVPPMALLLPKDQEQVAIVPQGVRQRDPERFELAPVKPLPRTYSGPRHPVHEFRDRMAAWIVGRAPLNTQREPGRYKSYGRQDAQTSGQPHLGAFLQSLADQLDAEDLDGQEQVLLAARDYLQGALRGIRMFKARYSDDSINREGK